MLGPDGSMVPDTGYFGLRGADAMSAREETGQHIDEIIREQRSNLSTPQSQYQFDVDTRRYRAQWQREMGAHADEQQREWATNTNSTSAQLATNAIARTPLDDANVAQNTEIVRDSFVKNAQLKFGNSPEVTKSAVLQADQYVAKARVNSLLESDPQAAERVFNENRATLSSEPDYVQMSERVKNRATDAQLGPASQSFLSQYTPAASGHGQGGFDAAWQFTLKHEGGYAAHDANGAPVNMGVNQTAHPEVDVKNLTPDQAKQIGKSGYWDKIGGDKLPPAMQTAAFDTSYIFGPAAAEKMVAQSGGDPQKLIALRAQRMKAMETAEPDKFGKYAKAWDQRNADLNNLVRGGAVSSQQGVADTYRQNYATIMTNARDYAEQIRPGDAVFADKFVARTAQNVNHYITWQEYQDRADKHTVFQAMNGSLTNGHMPTSMDEMRRVSPDVGAAMDRFESNDPTGYYYLETHMLTANSKGQAAGYGTAFYDNLKRVLAPTDDPAYVSDTSKLMNLVEPGSHGALSNTGFSALQQIQGLRGTPQGEAQVEQIRGFLKTMHGQLTFSNPVVGVRDQTGEGKYEKFLVQALPALEKGAKDGTLHDMLDPKSKNYLGSLATPFMRSQSEIMKDHGKAVDDMGAIQKYSYVTMRTALDDLDTDAQRKEALKLAAASGRISKPDAVRIAAERHYIQSPPPPVPLPSGMQ